MEREHAWGATLRDKAHTEWAGKAASLVLWNTAGALIFPVILLIFSPAVTLEQFGEQLRISAVYAFSIGTLATINLELLSQPIERLRPSLRIPVFIVALVASAVVGSLFANVVFIALGWFPPTKFWTVMRFGLRVAIAITLLMGAAGIIYETVSNRLRAATLELRTRQLAEERSRKLATEARLSSLESRIHPHFLFNTLNSISALIREDPAAAERTVERLAALLRYSLDVNARRLVSLQQELRIVQDYLEIEKTRFGDRLRYAIEVPQELEGIAVPPLALQTLVENSIKHAISTSRQGGEIRVTAREDGEHFLIEVSDDGPGFDLRALEPGHGLENLQDRLTALFEAEGRLEIARRDGRMAVAIAIPRTKALA